MWLINTVFFLQHVTTCKVLPLTYPWKKGERESCIGSFKYERSLRDIDVIVLVKNKEQQCSNIVSILPLLLPHNILSLCTFEGREQNFPSVGISSLMPMNICGFCWPSCRLCLHMEKSTDYLAYPDSVLLYKGIHKGKPNDPLTCLSFPVACVWQFDWPLWQPEHASSRTKHQQLMSS